MDSTTAPTRRLLRRLAALVWVGVPIFGMGCTQMRPMSDYPEIPATPVLIRQTASTPVKQPSRPSEIVLANHVQPAVTAPVTPQQAPPVVNSQGSNAPLPITLDTVFRLAEAHNPKIALAREKLSESQTNQANKKSTWLPDIFAGMAYYRHEGGNQWPDGRFLHSSYGSFFPGLQIQSELDLREKTFQQVDAQRQIWQQRAELSQVNNDILLDAATTYIDLLTARRGETLAELIESYELKLLDRAERLAQTEKGADALVQGMKAALAHRRQMMVKLRQQGNAASAKLVYLLGLPPGTCLKPIDLILAPIELNDVTPPPCELVEFALRNGPGIRELEGILATVQDALEKSYGIHNMLPIVQAYAYEGIFGAGVGGGLTFDNRLDMGVMLRWNLTQLGRSDLERQKARSKRTQAMLTYQELRNKLAAGVQEARDSILLGREQIGLATGGIRSASEHYRLSNRRLEENIPGASPSDVLLSIRGLEQAHFNHLTAISAHNKAQIRLMMLLGPTAPKPAPPVATGPALPIVPPVSSINNAAKKPETLPEPRKLPGM